MRILLLGAFLLHVAAFAAEDPFKAHVRPTEPLSPGQQLQAFHLPEGFEIQLVAAEPELRKPMNMAFDSAGRLWVTESREYPNAAPTNSRPRDTIRIFSDFDTNGRARSVGTFATNLNIPIGIYPFRSRNTNTAQLTWKCVVWSIPNIWLFEDMDGDGAADSSRPLYGPFDFSRDTHGNQASFRRGDDGWVYATHGFNNQSRLAGTDGHEVELISGNTYRFRLDGSRIEKWTHGQVNPFGMDFDRLGNLFSADCHSSPIYQLLRGACYPSFGRPHDGLGFAPQTIRHSHGSTAIAGLVVLQDPAWPIGLQDHILVGNVMTSRVNRDRLEWRGSTTIGHEVEDFLICDDPWFRPVDLRWGPDGALYIADFYNRIIGHYEVPRDHPGRDRERGRIWRVTHRAGRSQRTPDQTGANLLSSLGSSNPTLRSLALNETCDVIGRTAGSEFRALLGVPNEYHHTAGLWGLHRLRLLSERDLLRALITPTTLPRLAALRIASELPEWSDNIASIVSKTVNAENAHLRRQAVEVLGFRTNRNDVAGLLTRLLLTDPADTHLIHAIRIATRNQLATGGAAAFLEAEKWPADRRQALRETAIAVDTREAASFLLGEGPASFSDAGLRDQAWRHIARNARPEELERLATGLKNDESADPDLQLGLLQTIRTVHPEPAPALAPILSAWADKLCRQILSTAALDETAWGNLPPDSPRHHENPWSPQNRRCADNTSADLLSSHPHGERLRGRLRSRPFRLPKALSFYLCGHDGRPGQPALNRNRVRLRLVGSHRVIQEAAVPRNDTARRIEWDLREHQGRVGYFEAQDGIADSAYAWLAFGRFDPPLPEVAVQDVAKRSARIVSAAELAGQFQLRSHIPALRRLVMDENTGFHPRRAAAAALADLSTNTLFRAAAAVLGRQSIAEKTRNRFARELAGEAPTLAHRFEETFRTADAGQQAALADALTVSQAGMEHLLQLIEAGVAAPQLLREDGLRSRLEGLQPKRVLALMSTLPERDDSRAAIVTARVAAFKEARPDLDQGRTLFETACSACHQLGGQGRLVGPQLDGIGSRGAARLIEDILAPNRNVDIAFRTETIRLRNGEVVVALPRREAEGTLVVADAAGAERSIPIKEIEQRTPSLRSLMPDNFHEALSAAQLNDLVGYLIAPR